MKLPFWIRMLEEAEMRGYEKAVKESSELLAESLKTIYNQRYEEGYEEGFKEGEAIKKAREVKERIK